MNVCCKMALSDEFNVLVAQGKNAHGIVRTEAGFGCVHSEEKQQGPFELVGFDSGGFELRFHRDNGHITAMLYNPEKYGQAQTMTSIVSMLNHLWLEKEEGCSPKKSCHNCKHWFSPGFCNRPRDSDEEFSVACDGWSQK